MAAPTVRFAESFRAPVSAGVAWSLLTDPVVVAACMPGAAITGVDDDGTLRGSLTIALGPTRVTFSGTVAPEFDHALREGRLNARGSDTQGRTRAAALAVFRVTDLPATDADEPSAEITIDASIETSGALAPFARTGGARLADQLLQEFSANLIKRAGAPATDDRQVAAEPAEAAAPLGGFRLLSGIVRDAIRRLFDRPGRRRHSAASRGGTTP